MLRAKIKNAIEKAASAGVVFGVEPSENREHGDYSSNIAMVLAKKTGKNPREFAEDLKGKIEGDKKNRELFEKIEVAGPGFLNFFISHSALIEKLSSKNFLSMPRSLSKNGERGARPRLKFLSESFSVRPKKINIEFVSANPTGPLTMANGRGGFYGDVLANILEAVGHKVTREYYVNDAGNQVKLLGESILASEGKMPGKEEYYKGGYIRKLKGKSARQASVILLQEIKTSLGNAGIKFDVWFSEEKDLHKSGAVKKILEFLVKNKLVKEKEGALWLEDAVVVKSNKETTYFLADLAYHYDKFSKRKFDVCINIWGADHHGYIERMKKGVGAIGVDPERLQIIIMQLVRLMSKGKEVRMSKRTGEFVTLDELIQAAGVDAARWFFLERSANTHMDFDLDLAKEQNKKNPVYYVQYAHARACSILGKGGFKKGKPGDFSHLYGLSSEKELTLIKKILLLDEIIEDIASDYQVHRLTKYAYELAQAFTGFYESCKVIDANSQALTGARLLLVCAFEKTVKSVLGLMGISAPETM